MASASDYGAPQPSGSVEATEMLANALGNFVEQWRKRHTSDPSGDRADLVTPGDLLTLPPLQTVAAFRRDSNGQWQSAL